MVACKASVVAGLLAIAFMALTSLGFAQEAERGEEKHTPVATEAGIGRVSVDRLNVRARPGTSFEVVGRVVRDQELTVVGEQDEWLEIVPPKDTVAWCSRRYIDSEGRITGDNVRVRSGPGVVFSVFSTLPLGATVETIGEPEGEWQQIVVPPDATVWVHGQFVDYDPPATDVAEIDGAPPEAGDAIADPPPPEAGEEAGHIPKLSVRDIARIDAGETTVGAVMAPIRKIPLDDESTDDVPPPGEAETPPSEGVLPSFDDAFAESDAALQGVMIDETFIDTTDREADAAGTSDRTPRETREGTLVSLKTKSTEFATHILVVRRGDTAHLLCYVVSDLIDLSEWENHQVRVYGAPIEYPGWRTDVLRATGIQLTNP